MKRKLTNKIENDRQIIDLLSNFCLGSFIEDNNFEISLIKGGHLHDSFSLSLLNGGKTPEYIIQRLNPVFDLVALNCNLKLFELAQEKSQSFLPENWQTVKYLDVKDGSGKIYFDEVGNAWRIITYIPGEIRFFEKFSDVPKNIKDDVAYNFGQTLVIFHKILAQVPIGKWKTPLPNFHETNYHYLYLKSIIKGREVVSSLSRDKLSKVRLQKTFLKKYRARVNKLLTVIESQKRLISSLDGVGLSVQHGDPKINNAVFRKDSTNKWHFCALIDLDTIQVGSSLDDLGDALRSAGNVAGEQPDNLGLIKIDDSVVENLINGYLDKAKQMSSLPIPINLLRRYVYRAYAKFLYELGIRFLADSLIGNHYFRIRSTDPVDLNLYRGEVQLKMLEMLQKSYNI